MSLYNRSSLIQVPSLYKDGTLVSTIPEDRSGDFTVARGSNLAATRIGEDGYIKKGYENLLLQSNQFDTTWISSGLTLTSGQAGYDGSSDAWKFVADSTGFFRRITQSTNKNSIVTSSVYAKAGTADYIYMVHSSGSYSFGGYQFFDLTNGTLGASSFLKIIDASIEDVGNGWYRCTLVSEPDSQGQSFFGLSDANNNTNATSGNYIYIQDAQLNQGLLAYPYLETTTAPVQGGLLENTPRLDWSNGVPAVKLEEERTNFIEYSEYFDSWTKVGSPTITNNYGISPEGVQNSTRFETTSDRLSYDIVTINANETFSIYMKGSGTLRMQVGSDNFYPSVTSEWVRYEFTTTQVGTRNVQIRGNGSAVDVQLYGAQYERNDYPTSYIPTYGTSQTRLVEDYGGDDISSLVGDNEGTLFVEWEENPFLNTDEYVTSIGLFQLIGVDKIYISGRSTLLRLTSDIHTNIVYTFSTSGSLKIAFKYNGSEVILFVNGVEAGRETQNKTFNPTSFGNASTSITASVQENIKQILLFPTALSDDECIELTTI